MHFTAIKPAHWGARKAYDRHRGFNAYAIATQTRQRTLFAGDTAMTRAFEKARTVRPGHLRHRRVQPLARRPRNP